METEQAAPESESEPNLLDVLRQQQAAEPREPTRAEQKAMELDEAVAELERRQSQPQIPDSVIDDFAAGVRQNPDNFRDPDVERPVWIDGRDPNTPITADQAARAYTQYKAQKALEVLQQIDAAEQQQPAEAQQETEQPPELSAEEKAQQQQEELRAYFENLPPEQKAHIHAATQYAQERVAAAQARQQFTQAAQTAEYVLHAQVLNTLGLAQDAFRDIRSPADVEALQRTDPARAQIYAEYANRVATLKGEADTIRSQMQRAAQAQQYENQLLYAQQFQVWGEAQDRLAEAAIPEMRDDYDRVGQREFQNSTLAMLKEAGYSEAEVRGAWNGQPLNLRDARAQRVLADATRWRLAGSVEGHRGQQKAGSKGSATWLGNICVGSGNGANPGPGKRAALAQGQPRDRRCRATL